MIDEMKDLIADRQYYDAILMSLDKTNAALILTKPTMIAHVNNIQVKLGSFLV